MSRVRRFAIAGVFWLFAYIIHYLAIELFGPSSTLRSVTSGAEVGEATSASVHATIYQITAMWVPLGIVVFVVAWLLLQEYRQQTVSAYYPR